MNFQKIVKIVAGLLGVLGGSIPLENHWNW